MVAREGNTGMEQEGAKGKRGRYVNPIYSLAFLRTSSSHRWLRNKSVSWYVIQDRIYFTTDWWAEKYHFSTSWKYDEQTVCRPCVCQRWGLVAGFDGGTIANGSETLSREDLRWLRDVSKQKWREDCLIWNIDWVVVIILLILIIICISEEKLIINKKLKKFIFILW